VVTAAPAAVVTGDGTDAPGACGVVGWGVVGWGVVGWGGHVHVGGTGTVGGGTDELSAWAAPSPTELNPAVANRAATRLLRVRMNLLFSIFLGLLAR